MIILREVHKIYPVGNVGFHALKDINLKFEKGEFVSVLGQSGCGKTTLLNIIGGLDIPSSGNMVINGKLTTKFIENEWDQLRNKQIGFIFQNYNLLSTLSILDNVALPLRLMGARKKEARKKSLEMLTKVGLKKHVHKLPTEISGGQRQRVAIARALVKDPEIILADEPTGALDSKTGHEILQLIKQLSEDKLVIMVTHNKNIATTYSNRIIEMEDGRILNDSYNLQQRVTVKTTKDIKRETLPLFTSLKMGLLSLKDRKLRSIFVTLGISIGVIGLVLIGTMFGAYRDTVDSNSVSEKQQHGLIMRVNSDNISVSDATKQFEDYTYNSKVAFDYVSPLHYVDLITKDVNANYDFNNDNLGNSIASPTKSDIVRSIYPLKYGNKYPGDNELSISNKLLGDFVDDNEREYLSDDDIWKLVEGAKFNMPTSFYKEVLYNDAYKSATCTYLEWDGNPENVPADWDTAVYGNFTDNIERLATFDLNETYRLKAFEEGDTHYQFCADYSGFEFMNSSVPKTIEEFTLVSVFEGDNDVSAMLPKEYLMEIANTSKYDIRLVSFLKDDLTDSKIKIINDIERNHSLDVYTYEFNDYSWGLGGAFTALSYVIQFFVSLVMFVSVVTGIFMLLMILYISVMERTREIGLIRSLGGSKNDIRRIFTSETTVIGLAAGLFSFIFTVGLIVGINKYLGTSHAAWIFERYSFIPNTIRLKIRFDTLIYAMLAAFGISLIAGIIPSTLAANKKPIDALKSN